MNRNITIFTMALLTSAAAQAQQAPTAGSSVTLYGIIDAGVEHVTNVGASKSGLTRMPGLTGTLPSRWGLRGNEDLGNGLQAVLTLESGFSPDSGVSNQGGRLFGRQASIGLSGTWGTVALGRQNTMLYWSILDADQFGPNNYGLASHDSYIPNSRADNAISWRGKFGNFSAGAMYSFGRDTVNAGPSPSGANCAGESATDKSACREWSALLKYDAPNWGLATAIDELRGGTGAFGGLVRSDMKDTRVTVNGYVKFGATKLSAGVINRENDGAAPLSATNGQGKGSNLYWVAAAYSFSPAVVLDGHIQRLDFKNGGDNSTLAVLRSTYSLSKRTAVYAQAAHISNGGRLAFSVSSGQTGSNPPAGSSQDAVMVGVRHVF